MGLENSPTNGEKKLLRILLRKTDLSYEEKFNIGMEITRMTSFKEYERLTYYLEANAISIDKMENPNTSDITAHLNKLK